MAYLINVGFLCCVLLANEANGFDFGDGDILSSAFQELLVKIQEQGAKIASLEDTIRADRRDFNEKIEKSNLKMQGLEKTVESLKRIIAEMENKQVANNQDKISSQTENNTTAEIVRPLHWMPRSMINTPALGGWILNELLQRRVNRDFYIL